MNRFVCGLFTWQELSSTNPNLVPRLRQWDFTTEDKGKYIAILNVNSSADQLEFCITLDLGNETSPRAVSFYGHLPEVYCNDRFELASQLDRAREKLLSAVIRKIITEVVTKEVV